MKLTGTHKLSKLKKKNIGNIILISLLEEGLKGGDFVNKFQKFDFIIFTFLIYISIDL
jgi:hypothetical protein